MHRLEDFLARRVLPDLNSLRSSDDRGLKAMFRSRLIESTMWLHLGTDLGSFPRPAAGEVYDNCLRVFFHSLLADDEYSLNAMVEQRIYVAHSEESEALMLSFPRLGRILVEKAMRGEDVLSAESSGFRHPDRLRPAFQVLLMLGSKLSQDPAVTQFVYAINFVNDEYWEHSWRQDCNGDDIVAYDKTGEGLTSTQICAGFMHIWGYAERLVHFFSSLRATDGLAPEDVFKFTERARESQGWMVNLNSSVTARRFDQVRERVRNGILFESDRNAQTRKLFEVADQSMNDAFQFWFQLDPEPEVLTPRYR
jgi:hypothetical protein